MRAYNPTVLCTSQLSNAKSYVTSGLSEACSLNLFKRLHNMSLQTEFHAGKTSV